MMGVFCLILLFTVCTVHSQEMNLTPLPTEIATSSQDNANESVLSSTLNNSTLSDEGVIWDTKPDVPSTLQDTQIPQNPNNKHPQKSFGAHVLQKLSTIIRRVDEKINRIKAVLYPDYVIGGGGKPQQTCDKWTNNNNNQFVTGINGAIYGLSSVGNPDFPFVYRKLESTEKSTK